MRLLACYCEDMANHSNEAKPKFTYSIAETAEALGLSQPYVRRLAAEGRIAVVRFGKRVMVRRAEVERLASEGVA